MKKAKSKRLVIDANVARASSAKGTDGEAKCCRDFLLNVLSLSYRIMMTPEIRDEWDRRQSDFALRWRGTMARRNKVCGVKKSPADEEFRNKIEDAAEQKNQIPVMQKDFHLLEAARISDRTIISLERRVRRHFAYAAQHVDEIQEIVWVNPKNEEEEPLVWLRNGAPPEDHRKLRAWKIV